MGLYLRKTFFLLLAAAVAASSALAGDKNRLSLFFGADHVLEYGSESEYVPFENDFPVTPAHTVFCSGLSYGRLLSRKIGVELGIVYYHKTKVTLRDPQDGDEVKIQTSKHIGASVSFVYRLSSARFTPYLLAGGGVDFLVGARDQTVFSSLGYPVTIAAPEKRADFAAHIGAGAEYLLSSKIGLRAEVRYIIISTSPDAIKSLNPTFGILLKF